jgi:SAM-dependent methyltransferase
MSNYSRWDEYYRTYPLRELGWELGKPRPILVKFVRAGLVPRGKALDMCCGAGTNPLYLAENGLDVTAIDISKTALRIARKKACKAKRSIALSLESFVDLSFKSETFDFIFDMGCFHHVEIKGRAKFIAGVYQVLKSQGIYMLTCFSYQNGSGWNHFTKQQLIDLFSEFFKFMKIEHYSSLEGDGVVRFFYTVLMIKKDHQN